MYVCSLNEQEKDTLKECQSLKTCFSHLNRFQEDRLHEKEHMLSKYEEALHLVPEINPGRLPPQHTAQVDVLLMASTIVRCSSSREQNFYLLTKSDFSNFQKQYLNSRQHLSRVKWPWVRYVKWCWWWFPFQTGKKWKYLELSFQKKKRWSRWVFFLS